MLGVLGPGSSSHPVVSGQHWSLYDVMGPMRSSVEQVSAGHVSTDLSHVVIF